MDFERRCWAEVDLGALRHNFKIVKEKAGTSVLMAVVKADAYGHGDAAVASLFDKEGADRFAVSGFGEALSLRRAGITKPILILGYTGAQNAAALAESGITQTVFSLEYAKALSEAAQRAGVKVRVHIKVDTGMGRIGFTADDDISRAVDEIACAYALPGLLPEGIFTHFAAADSKAEHDMAYTRRQYGLLCEVIRRLEARGCAFRLHHCCNSAGTFAWPEYHLDLVRPGVILYGEQPSGEVTLPGLVPAMRLKAAVSMVKELAEGDAVSYGCMFRAEHPMRVATLAVGYADGYPRALSNRGTVDLHGCPARVLGRVCMDQMIVDVTDIPNVKAGDAAIVFGGGAADSVADVAEMIGTINYEVLCDVGRRVQRVYVENGVEVEIVDYLKGE